MPFGESLDLETWKEGKKSVDFPDRQSQPQIVGGFSPCKERILKALYTNQHQNAVMGQLGVKEMGKQKAIQ
jgi:hypothetical protein